ncbi:MarR family winged helix-turn-helix transcriptional regulator [Marinospirillum sp.]|uniref:MarR family winged helix-turn-helix transcriptional regulator n=1 Tax=Marinospirillum sp. TaxID=2183934 RepID=UPI00385158FE
MSDRSTTPPDDFTAVILQVFRTNGQMIAWGDHFSAPFGLTSARWQMLGALALSPAPLTAPQIAFNMGVTRQGAQKQLNLLLDEELAQKQPNPYHKRSPFYQLTDKGQALYQRVATDWNQHAKEVGQAFSSQELATTLKVLSRISELHETTE